MVAKDGGFGTSLIQKNRAWIATITKEVEDELGKRKIVVSEEEDQLRWGKKNEGNST
jgi:hypothetical protein